MAEESAEFKIPSNRGSSPEVDEWATTTTAGMLAGLVYGGFREAAADHSGNKDAVLPPGLSSEHASKATQTAPRPTPRSLMEERMIRISRASFMGALQLGALASLFSGVQLSLAVYRQKRDTINTTAAGAATAAALGLAMPGSITARLRGAAVGLAVGSVLAFPLGIIQTALQSVLPQEERASISAPKEGPDGVEQAIQRLEQHFEQRSMEKNDSPHLAERDGEGLSQKD